jgi:hypothetical protein
MGKVKQALKVISFAPLVLSMTGLIICNTLVTAYIVITNVYEIVTLGTLLYATYWNRRLMNMLIRCYWGRK